MQKRFLIVLSLFLVGGCFSNSGERLVGETVFNPNTLPPGTVQVSDSLFMIPLEGVDDDGCRGYRAYSPDGLVVQALHYRTSTGGFTMNKLDAACYENKT